MPKIYSIDEAALRLREILQLVRSGQRIIIREDEEPIAEIRPASHFSRSLEELLPKLEQDGVVSLPARPLHPLGSIAKKSGGLERFLEDRR